MKRNIMIFLLIIGTLLLVVVSGYSSNNINNTNPYFPDHLPNDVLSTLPTDAYVTESKGIDDAVPFGLYDEDGKLVWEGTTQEYRVLINHDPQIIQKIFAANEKGPKDLTQQLEKINSILNEKIPSHARVKQTHKLKDVDEISDGK